MHKEKIGLIKENYNNSSEKRWLDKPVKEEIILHDFKTMENLIHSGIGEANLEEFENNKILKVVTNTDIEHLVPRPSTNIRVNFGNIDLSKYNRISVEVYPKSVGHKNFYFHFSLINGKKGLVHAPSLEPNKWNHIVFELDQFDRSNIEAISITPFLMGCPIDAQPIIEIYFKDLKAQKVEEDYVLGWEIENRIAYCHSGYFLDAKKVAVTGLYQGQTFNIIDVNNKVVYTNDVVVLKNEYGVFYELDFSNLKIEGTYKIVYGKNETKEFLISNEYLIPSTRKSLNFLRLLRCGYDVSGVHTECHTTSYSKHPNGKALHTCGGWHDAGDVSQFEICTVEMAHALLDLALAYKDKDRALYEEILEEARWGLNWVLKTRFKDGYRALAVHYSIWRNNVYDPNTLYDDNTSMAKMNVAENGSFENLIASAAEAVGARVFSEIDSDYADWCKRCAISDFEFGLEGYKNNLFTKRWGVVPDPQLCGALVLACAELYALTGEDKYIDIADLYAHKIMEAQEKEYIDKDKLIRGFFYEDSNHNHILTYEHRGHEQTPVQALVRLYEVAKDHKNSKFWLDSIMLYKEFIEATSNMIRPYNLIPSQVYNYKMLRKDRFTIPWDYGTEEEIKNSFKGQIENGISLGNDFYLRRLPIAIQRRGYHATLLSKTKAISMIAKLLKDENLKQIAIDQIEWILGKNPFASSTMYGEGHNYHPLYVAFSLQMVGSLPVGFKTYENIDAPYWPTSNNAVFKEIWGHTTGKYLWLLADLL